MDRSKVAILIPALNEENSIGRVVENCLNYGEVIVVNDGSIDKTKLIANKKGAIVLNHPFKMGYDKALNTCFDYAFKRKYLFFVTVDADGQHNPSDLETLINKLDKGFEVVVGNRETKARLSEYVFSLYTKIFWNISDPLSGMKGYKSSVYEKLGYFDSYNSIGTELLLFSLKKGYKVTEIQINVHPRFGKSRFGNAFRSNLRILKSFIFSFFKSYN